MSALDEIRNLARLADWDRYIASLFLPEAAQPHVWALLSFVGEIVSIPNKVSDAAIGEIRLQWWHDTLGPMNDHVVQDHPIAKALSETVAAHHLPIAPLQALVDAHRFDLYADPAETWTDVEGYLGETDAILFQLTAMILNPQLTAQSADASGFAGVAFGLARAASNPALRSKLTPKGATDSDYHARAQQRLKEAQTAIATVPKDLLGVFLPIATTNLYLTSKNHPSQWRKQWSIWRAARRGMV